MLKDMAVVHEQTFMVEGCDCPHFFAWLDQNRILPAAFVGWRGIAVVEYMTSFPRKGLYKIWGQFKYKGKLYTAPFVIEVQE